MIQAESKAPILEKHLDHVEATTDIVKRALSQVATCREQDLSSLPHVYSFTRCSPPSRPPELHFDKDHAVSIPGYYVDLFRAIPVPTLEDSVFLETEERGSNPFSKGA